MTMKKKGSAADSRGRQSAPAPAANDKLPGLPRQRSRVWIWHAVGCAALALMVYIVYSNSFESGFVLDNQSVLKLDPRIKEASLENLKLIWSKDYWWPRMVTTAYRPIVSTTYLLNWSVLGNGSHDLESDQVVGFHWVNMTAHAVNAVLAYLLVLKLVRRPWLAFLTAALFAVHPIATEAVTNIIGRADELAAMSIFGGTLLYIRSTETKGLRRIPWLLGMMAVFGLGLLSKESVLSFMAVPILFDGIYRWGNDSSRGFFAKGILWDFLGYIAMAPPFAAWLYVRRIIFRDAPPLRIGFLDNPIVRFEWSNASSLSANLQNWVLARITACHVAVKGLWKLVWPVVLSSDYSYDQIHLAGWQLSDVENLKAVLSALFIAGTLVLAVWFWKRCKAVSFFILFYWVTYAPASNLVVTSTSIMAERFLYVPALAFFALLVLGLDFLARRMGLTLDCDDSSLKRPLPRLAPQALFLIILVLYGLRTYARNFDWRSDISLEESAVNAAPRSHRNYTGLAEAYYQEDPLGNTDRIVKLAESGVAIVDSLPDKENSGFSYMMLGIYYGAKGQGSATRTANGLVMNDYALEWFQKAAHVLERGSEIDLAVNAIGRDGEVKYARDAGLPQLYKYLGMSYSRLGMDEKALEAFKYMRHIDPEDPEAYSRIGSAQAALGRLDDAAVSFIECINLDPQRAESWQWLTDIYSRINTEPVPAVQSTAGRQQLREDNQMVQRHLLAAYADLLRTARSSDRPDMLHSIQDAALNRHHLDSKAFDEVLNGKIEVSKPPAPVFHTPGSKLPAAWLLSWLGYSPSLRASSIN
jgi:tetratricopeptide (TPR) repeat protein